MLRTAPGRGSGKHLLHTGIRRTLEKENLVSRVSHPADARAKQISVTPEGRRLARRAIALVEAVDDEFFDADGPELKALKRLLCSSGSR